MARKRNDAPSDAELVEDIQRAKSPRVQWRTLAIRKVFEERFVHGIGLAIELGASLLTGLRWVWAESKSPTTGCTYITSS